MDSANFPFRALRLRLIVGISIMLLLALVHWFRVGSYLSGDLYILYYSYASDLMLPFGCYFLLCMNEIQLPFLRHWFTKAAVVFLLMTFSEVMQYFDFYFFGTTFDPVDIIMFGIGVLMAVLSDVLIFKKIFPLWSYD